jgi:hypothetical protein
MAFRSGTTSLVLLVATVAIACSAVPNMDAGVAGCQNARGIGQPATLQNGATDTDVMPELRGLTPAEAASIARSRGHTVVFNVQGTCWCVPPPGGTVGEQWYGQHGALWLWVDGLEPSGDPGFLGHGC